MCLKRILFIILFTKHFPFPCNDINPFVPIKVLNSKNFEIFLKNSSGLEKSDNNKKKFPRDFCYFLDKL